MTKKETVKDITKDCVWRTGAFKELGFEKTSETCRECFKTQTETTEYCVHMQLKVI